jgi:hypothetical protein
MIRRMQRNRVILFASVVTAALVVGGLVGAAAASANLSAGASPLSVLAASSPSPTFKSNEAATHEAGESASQEAAENNGTFHPGGPGFNGGHPCGGHSNEDATHEKSETAAQEAAESAACPTPAASPSATK